MKNRLFGISCILLLLLPAMAGWVYLSHQKHVLRKNIKEQLLQGVDENELELLVFTEKEISEKLNWKHEKEFEYNGQMYDIAKSETRGELTYYWCWPDKEETQLNRQLKQLITSLFGGDQKNKEQKQKVSNFYNSLFSEKPFTPFFDLMYSNCIIAHYYIIDSFTENSIKPPYPPPQLS